MRIFLLFGLLAFTQCLMSQITVTSSTLPVVGDTLFVGVNNNPVSIDIAGTGPNNSWDLSDVNTNFITETVFRDPSMSDDADEFPNADLYVELAGGQGGVFYRRSNGTIYEVGRTGLDPITNNLPIVLNYDGEAVYRKTPLAYELEYTSDYSYNVSFSSEVIPDTLLAGLPIVPDSIKVSVDISTENVVDAWGELTLKEGTFDVLREHQTTNTDIGLQAKTIIGWIDVNPELLGNLGTLFESTTTESYKFYGADYKEILANVTVDEDGVADRVEVRTRDITSSSAILQPNQKDVIVSPNPSFGQVNFIFANMEKGKYTIRVNTILGKTVHKKDYWVDNNNSIINENLSQLRKGTYIYTIFDDKGRRITTKRLIILTP